MFTKAIGKQFCVYPLGQVVLVLIIIIKVYHYSWVIGERHVIAN